MRLRGRDETRKQARGHSDGHGEHLVAPHLLLRQPAGARPDRVLIEGIHHGSSSPKGRQRIHRGPDPLECSLHGEDAVYHPRRQLAIYQATLLLPSYVLQSSRGGQLSLGDEQTYLERAYRRQQERKRRRRKQDLD